MPIHLKKATNTDIPELIELEKSVAGTKVYSPMLTEDEWLVALDIGKVYLIEKDDNIVGNISYEKRSEDHAHISGLVIEPKFQGQGIGRQAVEQVLKELKDTKKVTLDVHPKNERALKLYQPLGFIIESQKENYYGDNEPRLILVYENNMKEELEMHDKNL